MIEEIHITLQYDSGDYKCRLCYVCVCILCLMRTLDYINACVQIPHE